MSSLRYVARLSKGGSGSNSIKRCATLADIRKHASGLWISDEGAALEVEDGDVVIIGKLICKGGDRPLSSVNGGPANGQSWMSICRHLVDRYWGAYIALEANSMGAGHGILRDPSGFLPCYRIDTDDHVILGSDLPTMVASGHVTGGVAWDRLFGHLLAPDIRRIHTCIDAVAEIPPGAVTRSNQAPGTESMIWSPWHFFTPSSDRSRDEEAERLRGVIGRSVSALAASYEHILVGVSGGLDSSILCAALAQHGHSFSCVTMATADPSGDERSYARKVADALGAPLLAHVYRPERIDLTRSSAPHLPRPVGQAFMQEIEEVYREEIIAQRADAVFTGNGGDNVFCFLHSAAPVIDRLKMEGPTKGVGRTMIDICAITECDVATMAKAVLSGIFRKQRPSVARDMRFLNLGRVAQDLDRPLTPYSGDTKTRLPGQKAHIDLLTRIQNFIEGYDRANGPPVVSPLLSQPIVEACLEIPSWRWCEGGINRSVARRAFASSLPAAILARTSKAGPDSLMASVFERGRPVLRELLLDGLLRRERIIDASETEAALADPAISRSQSFYRLLALAEAETWARSWLARLPSGTNLHR